MSDQEQQQQLEHLLTYNPKIIKKKQKQENNKPKYQLYETTFD